jgi:hypothetical protein
MAARHGQQGVTAMLLAAVVVVVGRPSPAVAGCVKIAGGLFRSDGCVETSGESNGRGEGSWPPGRRSSLPPIEARPFEDFHPRFPRMPLPITPAKEGPTTLADLRLVPDGKGGYRGKRPGFEFTIARDGTIDFHDGGGVQMPGLLALGALGIFDLTDMVIRLQGGDPYVYDKSLVVALTRPMRDDMTDKDRLDRLAQALATLPANLRSLWNRQDIGAPARRALLFRLWDELVEGGADPEGQAAAQARGLILRFIEVHLPAGSVDGYSREELHHLNSQRRSAASFAPYAADR